MFKPRHICGFGAVRPNNLSGSICGGQRLTVTAECSFVIRIFVAIVLLAAFLPAQADSGSSYLRLLKGSEIEKRYLYTSLYTKHYDPEPDHVNNQNMLGFENQFKNKDLWGFVMFDNSFGQESQYLYAGRKWRAFESDNWYYKLTGGLLNGYEEPYEDKIPFNDLGIAPAVIPSLGYRNKTFFVEFVQLGLAAGMVTAGFSF